MRKSGLATLIFTLLLVAATIFSACSPVRPAKDTRTAVPSDMPGARNSAAFAPPSGNLEISQPLPGTVVTNTVTVVGAGQPGAAVYHVDLESDGLTLADATVTPTVNGSSSVFSATLTFQPVAAAADANLAVYTVDNPDASAQPEAVIPVRLAPASTKIISGPTIRLAPERGKAGTPVVVQGEGFPAERAVEIRLSGVSTEATEHAYASGTTSKDGGFRLSFTMPAFWPNGDPIVSPEVLVVASTPDFVSKATAVFEYNSSVSPEAPTPAPGIVPVIRSSRELMRERAVGAPAEVLRHLGSAPKASAATGGLPAIGTARARGLQAAPGVGSLSVED